MNVIPLVTDDVATLEQRALFREVSASRGAVPDLFRAMAHSPEVAKRLSALGHTLKYESTLSDRLRESVILAMAGRWDARYVRNDHELLGRRHGLTEEAVARLAAAEPPNDAPPLERDAVRYLVDLAISGRPRPDLLGRLAEQLDHRALVDLHVLAGYYTMVALFLNGLAVPIAARKDE